MELFLWQEVMQKKNITSLMAARALQEASAAESVIRCLRLAILCIHYPWLHNLKESIIYLYIKTCFHVIMNANVNLK